jgi:cation transport ATPase
MSAEEGPVSTREDEGERRHEKLDRELMELLDELRVALPGVQVLFAFLLTVAFSQGFAKMTVTQRNVYFATLLTTAATTAFLMAPTAFHRLRWRRSDKERLLTFGNRMAITGIALLAVSVCGAVFLISDVLFDARIAVSVAAAAGALFAGLWFVFPLARAARGDRKRPLPG